MTTWRSLSSLVLDLHPKALRLPQEGDLRERAAALTFAHFGEKTAFDAPAVINVSALAISCGERVTVHQLRPAAAELVHETDLHSLPSEPPRLLRRAWIVEVRRPETGERLFGDTVCLAGYPIEDAIYLVGIGYPDGAWVARWRPRWTGEEIEASVPHEVSPLARDQSHPLISDVDAHHDWAREAARFAVVLGLLLEAEGVPIRVETEQAGGEKKSSKKGKGAPAPGGWTVRHVYLEEPARGSRASSSPAGATAAPGVRLPESVPIRGHLKRQRHGPGLSLTKVVYVAGYEARRWVAPKPRRVVVQRGG